MAKAHIEVSDASELVSAVTQMHALEIRQAQKDFYKGIQVYGERYPIYSMWMRVFFAQSALCLIGFIAMTVIAFTLVNETSDQAEQSILIAVVCLLVASATCIAGFSMRYKRHQIPRPKQR